MPGIVVGTGKLRVNAQPLPVADEIRFMPEPEKRDPLVGLDGEVAEQITRQAVWIEASLRYSRNWDLSTVTSGRGVTVSLDMADGSSWEMSNAFYSGDSEVDVKDGKVAARWHAQSMRQVL